MVHLPDATWYCTYTIVDDVAHVPLQQILASLMHVHDLLKAPVIISQNTVSLLLSEHLRDTDAL